MSASRRSGKIASASPRRLASVDLPPAGGPTVAILLNICAWGTVGCVAP